MASEQSDPPPHGNEPDSPAAISMPFKTLPTALAILYDYKERQYYSYAEGRPRRPCGDFYKQNPRHKIVDAPNWPAIDQAIETLNRVLFDAKDSLQDLLGCTAQAPPALRNDPALQCDETFSTLALINSLFGITSTGYGYITAVTEQQEGAERIIHFRRTDAFLLGLKHP